MQIREVPHVKMEEITIPSQYLERGVRIDFYIPAGKGTQEGMNLLLINDGQDLPKFHFHHMLNDLQGSRQIAPLFCAGIHCGAERKMEYGTAAMKDYKGRGAKASFYKQFVMDELLSFIKENYPFPFKETAYAGFSLGGLAAIDTVWHHPEIFSKAGVFSGSLWWRLKDLNKGYNEATDRIIHKLVRESVYKPGLKFYFTTGSLDEKVDRNKNGIIDSIDDTLGLIEELEKKGYTSGKDIQYVNFENGRHDVHTWGKAMPEFLKWGWGSSQ